MATVLRNVGASRLIVAFLPAAIVFWANAWFVWNHFVDGAYMHDSGWYSAIVWHNGVLPTNPRAAEDAIGAYYDVHVSPLVSIASMLSYLVPLDRVRWYCIFQASIYTPLVFAATLVVRERQRLRDALFVGGAALTFALSGQVIQCIGYPHFEIFVVVGISFMLVGFATGKTKLAWAGLFMAAATREDGGFHAAFFCAAVVASDLSGRRFPIPRRTVIVMFAVATLASVIAFAVQKTFFHPINLFRREYLGEQTYAHVTATEMWQRTKYFFDRCAFIAFPLVGTIAIAIARRDARYLLGWAVELPWLLLNLFAHQEAKFHFTVYTGFPFVASYFWVGAYDVVAREKELRRLSPLAALATVSLLSTCGVVFSDESVLAHFVRTAKGPTETPSKPIESFIAKLRRDPNAYGSVVVDPAIASWALESITNQQHHFHTWHVTSFEGRDAAIFYANGEWKEQLLWFLARSPFERCGHLRDTPLFMCARSGHPLPEDFVEDSPVAKMLLAGQVARHVHDGFNVDAHPTGTIATYGPYVTLPKGTYTVTWHFRWGVCLASANARGAVDVMAPRGQLAGDRIDEPMPTIDQTFTLDQETTGIEFRAWAGRCAYAIDRVDFRSSDVLPAEPWR